eukprot:c48724_g1_i1 orf=204-365(-)
MCISPLYKYKHTNDFNPWITVQELPWMQTLPLSYSTFHLGNNDMISTSAELWA